MDFPLEYVRGCFPSVKDSSEVFFDNRSAPQPLASVRATSTNGPPDGSAEDLERETRQSLAFFLNSNSEWADDEIVIAPSAALLSKRLSAALSKDYPPSYEVLTTELDDEGGLEDWKALDARGGAIRNWAVKRPNAVLDSQQVDQMLTDQTRMVVMAKASSSVGSIVELLPVALAVQDHQSSLLINWSAFLPHGAIDIRFLRSDFIIASTRMFFGAELGFLWGSRERMQKLRVDAPEMFEGLAVPPETLAGFRAALAYVEELGLVTQEMQLQPSEDYGRRRHMRRGMQAIRHYERSLTALALRRLATVPGLTVFGISDETAAAHRIPHILFRIDGQEPGALAHTLREQGIHVGHGNGDAPSLMRALGLDEATGASCISMLHYNSEKEIEKVADALHALVPAR